MSLSDLASLGSFVSGVAVAITLIFLLLQMRQSDRNQRAVIRMSRTTRANDLFALAITPDLNRVITKASLCEELSNVEVNCYMQYCAANLTNYEDSYFQYRAGVLDKAIWEGEEMMIKVFLSRPSFRVIWQILRITYSSEFRHYVDGLLGQVPAFQSGSIAAYYNPAVQQESARAKSIDSLKTFSSALGLQIRKG